MPLAGWRHGIMAAFELAALAFLATLPTLIRLNANDMRHKAAEVASGPAYSPSPAACSE